MTKPAHHPPPHAAFLEPLDASAPPATPQSDAARLAAAREELYRLAARLEAEAIAVAHLVEGRFALLTGPRREALNPPARRLHEAVSAAGLAALALRQACAAPLPREAAR